MKNKSVLLFFSIIAAACLLRWNHVLGTHRLFDLDSTRDVYIAREIALNRTREVPDSDCSGCWLGTIHFLKNSGFYFYFLSVPYGIFRGTQGIIIFNIINGLVFCVFTYLVIKRLFSVRIALFSVFIAAVSPFFIEYNTRTNQSYYGATFAAIVIWLLLTETYRKNIAAFLLAFVSMMIHFSSIPLVMFAAYKTYKKYGSYTMIEKTALVLLSVCFLGIFLRFSVVFGSNNGGSSPVSYVLSHYSVWNIVLNIRDIYTNILQSKYVFFLICIFTLLSIKRLRWFFPLIAILLVTGLYRIDEYSGYYSSYYLLIFLTVGMCIDFIYTKNKYIAILLLVAYIYVCQAQDFRNNLTLSALRDFSSDTYDQDSIKQINTLNPRRLPMTSSFEGTEYIFPFYYYANNIPLRTFLSVREKINQDMYSEGVLVCVERNCSYIRRAGNKKEFTRIGEVDDVPLYYWKRK